MNLEIHKPELAQRVQAQIQSGNFHDTDELIEKALDALDERTSAVAPDRYTRTGTALIAALQASLAGSSTLNRPAFVSPTCRIFRSDGVAS